MQIISCASNTFARFRIRISLLYFQCYFWNILRFFGIQAIHSALIQYGFIRQYSVYAEYGCIGIDTYTTHIMFMRVYGYSSCAHTQTHIRSLETKIWPERKRKYLMECWILQKSKQFLFNWNQRSDSVPTIDKVNNLTP